jgi:FKBP-type peptidyl-prolyl cis-trans isomerase (trigger factor)
MGVQVNEPEVNGRIAAMAAQRGVPPAQMRQDLERAGRLSELALSIREQKVLDRILDKATFTEISADKWNEAEDKRRDEAMAKAKSSKGGSKKKA